MQDASSDSFLITPEQTLAFATRGGLRENEMALSGIAVLTFNRGIVDRLEQICHLEDAEWISRCHHPYAAARLAKRGEFDGLDVIVLVPPMGASPLSCMIEDLVACGVQAVYLACAAWSLGPPVQFGDIIVPSFSLGPDGTSIHYGNDAGEVRASQRVVDALTEACRARGARHYVGGNAVCEALYRISPQMVADFRERGCLCMENGEASTLFAATQALEVIGGVLFQPYIDLQTGWDPARLDEIYRETCHLQAELVLEASLSLADQGLLSLEAQGSSSLADQGASSLAGQGLLGGGE